MVATAAILLGALVTVAAQYLTRRRALASAVAAAGLLVTYVVGSTWRWPLLAPAAMTPAWANTPAMLALDATGDSVTIERGMWIRDQPVEWKEARAEIRLRGLEPGWTAAVALRQALLRIPGKAALNNSFRAHPSTVIVDDHAGQLQDLEVMRRLLDVSTLIDDRSQERGENAILMFVRGTDLARLAPAQGAYEGQFEVALRRHVIEGVIPLRPGASYQSGPYRLLISSIQVEPGHVSVVTGESNAVSVFARRPQTMRTMYLRNRRVSQAIPGSSFPIRADMTLLRFLPFTIGLGAGEASGFGIEALAVDFPPNYARRAVIDFDEAWIRDAEVVVVRSTQEGSVSRELTIADFPVR
jgi:hypothetical protein